MNWKRCKPIIVMVAVEFGFALVQIFLKKALNWGLDHLVIVVYRQSICTIFMIPFVLFLERSSWTKLTASLIGLMFLCALLGLTLAQYLFLVGLNYTSATFTCAFINMIPVFTFVLAWPLGMEKVNMKSNSGKAKVFGTLTCALGALMLPLYKGALLIGRAHFVPSHERPNKIGLGSAILSLASLVSSSWYLAQSRIGHKFPYQYSSTTIMSLFSAIQAAIMGVFITRGGTSKWILKGGLEILIVVYCGVVGSGLCYAAMSWSVKQRGPVFTSAFLPLMQIFTGIVDVLLLKEEIYLGSILGSVVVIVGVYALLWGKSKDEEVFNTIPKRISGEQSMQDSAPEVTSQ